MDRLITIDDAMSIFDNFTGGFKSEKDLINFRKMLEDVAIPSAEPKMGHWIGIDEEPHEDYECDKCGYVVSTYTANIKPHMEYKFCPSCGARMFEPQERSDKE